MEAFCIDLARNGKPQPTHKLEILDYSGEDLRLDMEAEGAKHPEELSDFDRMVFSNERDAEDFLTEYLSTEMLLTRNNGLCAGKYLPAMAYRKRHLILGIMGLKLETNRVYKKDWPAGTLFNLHDRTNFVTVRLLKIVAEKNGTYTYKFELWKK